MSAPITQMPNVEATPWSDLSAYVGEYVEEYEFRGDTDYAPNEQERMVMQDAIEGLMADERFIELMRIVLAFVDAQKEPA